MHCRIFICIYFIFFNVIAHGNAETLVGGIQVNEADHAKWIASVQSAGLNTIAVTSYAHQGDWDSSNLWFSEPEENVIDEIQRAKKAGLKVVLILRVAIDHAFEKNRHLWHGMIMPRTDADLDEWFRRYKKFVRTWARVAQHEGVDVLGVGSEMNSLTTTIEVDEIPGLHHYYLDQEQTQKRREKIHAEIASAEKTTSDSKALSSKTKNEFEESVNAHREWALLTSFSSDDEKTRIDKINKRRRLLLRHWESVIAETRQSFTGPLTYASNFDQFHKVEFWNDLDIIGINAYFKLRNSLVADKQLYSSLLSGWNTALESIYSFEKAQGILDKKTMFTELGFRFRKNSTIQPWAMDGFALVDGQDSSEQKLIVWENEPIDYRERALALRALRDACAAIESKYELSSPFLDGILYWKLSSIPSHTEVEPFVHILNSEEDKLFSDELRSFGRRQPTWPSKKMESPN